MVLKYKNEIYQRIELKEWKKKWKKTGNVSGYVYSQSCENLKTGSFFVFSADDSKTSVTAWVKCLSAPKRSNWVLPENGMVNRLLIYLSWDIEVIYITKLLSQRKNTKILHFQELASLLMIAQNVIIRNIF